MLRTGALSIRVLSNSVPVKRHTPCLRLLSPRSPIRAPTAPFHRHGSTPVLANGDPTPQPEEAASSSAPQKPKPGTEIGTQNEFISYQWVRLVDPDTGELRPMARLSTILQEYRSDKAMRKRHSVQLVANGAEPIVKVVDPGALYRKAKEMKQRARENARFSGEKEIQLTWDVAGLDHQRKMEQAREGLAEGQRVSLVYAPKKGVRFLLTPEEMAERAQEDVDALSEVGREWKERDVRRRITVVYLESTKVVAPVEEKEVVVPFTASQKVVRQRMAEVQKMLEGGSKVKLRFTEEKERKEKKPQETGAVDSVADALRKEAARVKQQAEAEAKRKETKEWTRKKKDTFVEETIKTLKLGEAAKEWRSRDLWTASTTLYLTSNS
ncbi:hypothetical protein BXZ70DRAFT_1006891 [Cristinia sonorae]|uniref:Translation initiation factor 3 N-terminal domain-containing protein n=1 Tax=Cristinia sonorae TaxID=1940300 RepID=A0A8K0XRW5_9AGAR|nr:hypothetical protein BXZ70DRAFT_1006891 [Cristinia sonorae]